MTDLVPVVIAGAALAGLVQGLSGFAFGLVAMSLWAWTLDPQLAAVLVVVGALSGQVLTKLSPGRPTFTPIMFPYFLGAGAGLPLGLWLLPSINLVMFKLLVGTFLVAWCPVMLFGKTMPAIRGGGRPADCLVGLIGGAMAGLGGLSGPVPAFWTSLRGLDKRTQRDVIQNFNLVILATTLAAYLATGIVRKEMLPMIAVLIPAGLIPTYIGSRLFPKVPELHFRQLILVLLTLSGGTMLVSTMFQG